MEAFQATSWHLGSYNIDFLRKFLPFSECIFLKEEYRIKSYKLSVKVCKTSKSEKPSKLFTIIKSIFLAYALLLINKVNLQKASNMILSASQHHKFTNKLCFNVLIGKV